MAQYGEVMNVFDCCVSFSDGLKDGGEGRRERGLEDVGRNSDG